MGKRDRTIAALQIALLDVVALAGLDICQRRQHRCPVCVLFREPDLITANVARAEEIGVVRGDDQLCPLGIGLLRRE